MANKELIGELKEAMEMWIKIFLENKEIQTPETKKIHAKYYNWIGKLEEILQSDDINLLGVDDTSKPEDFMSNIEDMRMFKTVIKNGAEELKRTASAVKISLTEKIEDLKDLINGSGDVNTTLANLKTAEGLKPLSKIDEILLFAQTTIDYEGLNETKLNAMSVQRGRHEVTMTALETAVETIGGLCTKIEDLIEEIVPNVRKYSTDKVNRIPELKNPLREYQDYGIYEEVRDGVVRPKVAACYKRIQALNAETSTTSNRRRVTGHPGWVEIGTNIYAKIDETNSDVSALASQTLTLFKDALINGIIPERGTGQSGVKWQHNPPQVKVRRTRLESQQEAPDLRLTGAKQQIGNEWFVTFDGVGHGH
ncbi:MAG: hypothetical protein GY810_20345 [Aureispira sp.]|nr:hypothetical protein [Aureispira sp.]